MTDRSFTTGFTVAQTPETVFAAIGNLRGWWSEGITGRADKVGDRFTHQVPDLHRCDLDSLRDLIATGQGEPDIGVARTDSGVALAGGKGATLR